MRHDQRPRRRRWSTFAVLVALWLVFPGARSTLAQPYQPRPIAVADLSIYADRLGLSGEQRNAMDEAYVEYLERCLSSRPAPPDLDPESEAALAGMPRAVPEPADLRAWLAAREGNLALMRSLDEGLFSSLQAMLTEPQQAALPRVRSLRERMRLTQDEYVSEWYDARRHYDLGILFDHLDLLPDQAATAMPLVEQYEQALTNGLRRLRNDTGALRERWRKRVDGEAVDAQAAWRDEAIKLRPQALETVALHRTYAERLGEVLPERAGVILRYQFEQSPFYQRTLTFAGTPTLLHFARSLDSLTPEQAEALAALEVEARAEWRRLAERLGPTTEDVEYFYSMVGAMHVDFFPGTPEERTARLRPINEMLRESQMAASAMYGRVEAIIDKEQLKAVRAMIAEQTRIETTFEFTFADRNASRERRITWSREVAPPESFLPTPLSEAEGAMIADLLQFSDSQRGQLRAVIDAQLSGYRALQSELVDPLTQLVIGTMARPILDRPEMRRRRFSPPADVEHGLKLMRAFIERAAALEETLHAELLALVSAEQRDAAEALWQCRTITTRPSPREYRYEIGVNDYMMALRCNAARIDPVSLLADLPLSAAERSAVLQAIIEEAPSVRETALELHQARLDGWTTWCELYSVVIESEYRDKESFTELSAAYPRHDESVRLARHEAVRSVSRLAERIRHNLSPTNAESFRRRFERAAFPVVTYDPTDIAGRFEAALQREGLSHEQRASAALLRAEYDGRAEKIADQLIELDLQWEEAHARGQTGEAIQRRVEADIDQVRFEREALNYIYGRKLSAIIGAEVAQQ